MSRNTSEHDIIVNKDSSELRDTSSQITAFRSSLNSLSIGQTRSLRIDYVDLGSSPASCISFIIFSVTLNPSIPDGILFFGLTKCARQVVSRKSLKPTHSRC